MYFATVCHARTGCTKGNMGTVSASSDRPELAVLFASMLSVIISLPCQQAAVAPQWTWPTVLCSDWSPCTFFWWFEPKTFLFVLFVVSAIGKRRLCSCAIPCSHVCIHCLNAIFISFLCLSQRKPKETFFSPSLKQDKQDWFLISYSRRVTDSFIFFSSVSCT